jgi:hypothetical protein
MLAVAAAGLVGCGGSGSANAGADDSGGNAAAGTSSQGSSSSDEARAQFAQCMREQGIDIPDQAGAGGASQGQPPISGIDPDALQKAMAACQQYLQGAAGPAPGAAGSQDARAEFIQCMRDEGVDLPEPQAGQAPTPGSSGLDSNDPAVQAALDECGSLIQGGVPGQGDSP